MPLPTKIVHGASKQPISLSCVARSKSIIKCNNYAQRRKILPDVYKKNSDGKSKFAYDHKKKIAKHTRCTETPPQNISHQPEFVAKDASFDTSRLLFNAVSNIKTSTNNATGQKREQIMILSSSTNFPLDDINSNRIPNLSNGRKLKLKGNCDDPCMKTGPAKLFIPPFRKKKIELGHNVKESNSIVTGSRSLFSTSNYFPNKINNQAINERPHCSLLGPPLLQSILKNRQIAKSDSTSDTSSMSSITEALPQTDSCQDTTQFAMAPKLPENVITKGNVSFINSSCEGEIAEGLNDESSLNLSTNISPSSSSDPQKQIRFNPRILVHEFSHMQNKDMWFTESDLTQFKYEAAARIRRRWSNRGINRNENTKNLNIISSGTGRIIGLTSNHAYGGSQAFSAKALFSDPALSVDWEEEEDGNDTDFHPCLPPLSPSSSYSFDNEGTEERIPNDLTSELRSVLLVDPRDIFLKLLSKGIQALFPHIIISTAHSASEAREKILKETRKSSEFEGPCTHGFDIIVVEERLGIFQNHKPEMRKAFAVQIRRDEADLSGGGLIHCIKSEIDTMKRGRAPNEIKPHYPLLIGMSAYVEQDKELLKECGSDCIWGKPPPVMNGKLRNELISLMRLKRNRDSL